MRVTRVVVVLAVAADNQHAAHLRRLRRAYFVAEETTVAGALTPAQRRVLALFRRFGDCAYTEVR